MRSIVISLSSASRALPALAVVVALAAPAGASGQGKDRPPLASVGTLAQVGGPAGCLVDRSVRTKRCTSVRALRGPAPFLGSNAVAISPDGKHVYVASSKSDAIAIFRRNAATGRLTQRRGTGGCVAASGAGGCAPAVGLDGPNSVAVSADGKSVYATALASDTVASFRRDASTGALTQLAGASGCVANAATSGCATGRALDGPDVVAVSPDGANVYVGAFRGNAVAVLARDAATGALTQPADATGCIADTPTAGCTTGLALGAPEGMAISGDGTDVYVAAAGSSALVVLARDPSTGALTQPADGTGCIVATALAGCTTGTQISGANAVAVSPDDGDVYVTSLLSNSVTAFTRTPATGRLAQQAGTSGCVTAVPAAGCAFGRALKGPEGLAVSPDGDSVYAASFASAAIDVFDRDSGALTQKPRRAGCVSMRRERDCARARALRGVSSVAVSPDGRHVYAAAFASNAVGVFRRATRKTARDRD